MGIGWNINHALSCTMLIGRRDEANFEHTKISANLNNLRPKNKGGERDEESGEVGRGLAAVEVPPTNTRIRKFK